MSQQQTIYFRVAGTGSEAGPFVGGRWGAERTLLATEVCTVGQKQFNGRLLHADHLFILGGPLLNLCFQLTATQSGFQGLELPALSLTPDKLGWLHPLFHRLSEPAPSEGGGQGQ